MEERGKASFLLLFQNVFLSHLVAVQSYVELKNLWTLSRELFRGRGAQDILESRHLSHHLVRLGVSLLHTRPRRRRRRHARDLLGRHNAPTRRSLRHTLHRRQEKLKKVSFFLPKKSAFLSVFFSFFLREKKLRPQILRFKKREGEASRGERRRERTIRRSNDQVTSVGTGYINKHKKEVCVRVWGICWLAG